MLNLISTKAVRKSVSCNFNRFSYAIHENRIIPPHVMFYMLEGEWEIWQDDQKYVVKKDQIMFLFGNHHTYGINPSSSVVRTSFVHFDSSEKDLLLDENQQFDFSRDNDFFVFPTIVDCKSNPEIKNLFAQIVHLFFSKDNYSEQKINGYLFLLLSEISKAYNLKSKIPEMVENVIQLINDSFDRFASIEELAKSQYVCEKTLTTHFKKATGMTIHQYQTMIKMKMANNLLEYEKDVKLRQLAEQFGYCDEYHFCKAYKKYFGKSPKSK